MRDEVTITAHVPKHTQYNYIRGNTHNTIIIMWIIEGRGCVKGM